MFVGKGELDSIKIANHNKHPSNPRLRSVALLALLTLLALLSLLSDQISLHLRESLSGPSDDDNEAEVADELADHCGDRPPSHPLAMKYTKPQRPKLQFMAMKLTRPRIPPRKAVLV